MDKWAIILGALFGAGGFGGLLVYFVVPAPKKFDSFETRIKKLEDEVVRLRYSNRFLSLGLTALTMHSDALRTEIMRHEQGAVIETASEVLSRVRHNMDVMEGMEQDGDTPPRRDTLTMEAPAE